MTPPDNQPDPKEPGDTSRYIGLGIQFIVSVGLPLAGGMWLDWRTNRWPVFTLIGLALGFAAGLYTLLRTVYPPGGGGQRQ